MLINFSAKSDEPEESSSHGSCSLDKNGFYSVNNDFEFDECCELSLICKSLYKVLKILYYW